MNIQVSVFCDAAFEYQNRLCLLGTFDTIETKSLPVVKTACAVAVQLLWNKLEEGQHTVTVKFMDEDGNKTLNEVKASIKVSVPAGAATVATNHIVNIQQLKFNKAGSYQATIYVDDVFVAEIPLYIILAPKQ